MNSKHDGIRKAFWKYEGPTWVIFSLTWVVWGTLLAYHDALPWYILWPIGGFIIALYSSFVHESVHNMRTVPRWVRTLIFFLPISVWYPYQVYGRSHITHHNDENLTDPDKDPESFYYHDAAWHELGPVMQFLKSANQTFVGRMVLGPVFALYQLITEEAGKLLKGDSESIMAWMQHAAGLIVLYIIVENIAEMPWWQYLIFFAHPGLAMTMIRSFLEHRHADDPAGRTAIVESGPFFGLMFLNNNFHVVHHQFPNMLWYEIPAYFREHRAEILGQNGRYYYRGYLDVIRRYFLTPTFKPVLPPR